MKNYWIKSIAVLEIIGGIVGILFCVYISVTAGFALNVMVVLPVSLGIFILSLISGVYLWKETSFGRRASIIVQFIQLPKLISPAFTFMFSFGLDLFPHMTFVNDYSTVGVQFRFLADGQLFFMTQETPVLLGISIPALIALVKLQNYNIEKPEESEQAPPGPDEYFGTEQISDNR